MATDELHFKAPVTKTEPQWNFSTKTFPISEMEYKAGLFFFGSLIPSRWPGIWRLGCTITLRVARHSGAGAPQAKMTH